MRRKKSEFCGFLIVSILLIYGAMRTVLAEDFSNYAEIDRQIKKDVIENHIPGMAVIVVDKDNTLFTGLYSDCQSADTPFIIGSMSKSFTALAIMQLVEDNEIELDAPIWKYIDVSDWFIEKEDASTITVRNLLNHTSGIATYQTFGNLQRTEAYGNHVYANANYGLLGLMIESVSGMSYEEYITKNIFVPLDMKHSAATLEKSKENGLIKGYRNYFGFPVAGEPDYPGEITKGTWTNIPAGYLSSSINDMGKYLQMYLRNGNGIISKSSMDKMFYENVPVEADTYYGMGWMFSEKRYHSPMLWHAGLVENYASNMFIFPQEGKAVAVLVNGNDFLVGNNLIQNIINPLLGEDRREQTNQYVLSHLLINIICLLICSITIFSIVGIGKWKKKEKKIRHHLWDIFRHLILPSFLLSVPLITGTPIKVLWLFVRDLTLVIYLNGTALGMVGVYKLFYYGKGLIIMETLKNKLMDLVYICITKIIELFLFIYDAIRQPIRNISIWISILLSYIIYENVDLNYYSIKGKDMFLMSAGLVSIMTFITNYLERQTIDMEKKDNFYLGFNIKKRRFHDNFWLRGFQSVPIKLFFWIIASIPVIIMGSDIIYNSEILKKLMGYIQGNIRYLKVFWMAVFAVSAFYCVAILIESVSLSRQTFSQSQLYRNLKKSDEYFVKRKIEKYFKEAFKQLFNIRFILGQNTDFIGDVEALINYIINRASDVSSSEKEFNEYIERAFYSEQVVIDNLLKRLFEYDKCTSENKLIKALQSFLFKKTVEMIDLYYRIKWRTIERSKISPLQLLKLATSDLKTLLEIEEKLSSNEVYKIIFWREYRKQNALAFGKSVSKSNFCISKIVDILEDKTSRIDFFEKIYKSDVAFDLFHVLHRIDSKVATEQYFSSIFKQIYFHAVDDEEKNDFIKDFSDKIKGKHLLEYIILERNVQSKNRLMNRGVLSKEKIQYLIKFLSLKDIVSVLVFRLADFDRSNKGTTKQSDRAIMSLEEFKVWKEAIYSKREDIEILKKQNFISELCDTIAKSEVSYFLYGDFLQWLWESLFENFDKKIYKEFVELGKKGIRRSFSLSSYIIVRLLLCSHTTVSFSLSSFSKGDIEEVTKELSNISDILREEGL